jgi:hypothetical protein
MRKVQHEPAPRYPGQDAALRRRRWTWGKKTNPDRPARSGPRRA